MIRLLLAALVLLSAPAIAAERRVGVGSFDRVRVNGPFEVTIAAGSPGARVGGDPRVIERVEVRVDGGTLTIRMGQGLGEQGAPTAKEPVTVALSSPSLRSVTVFAGGRVTAARIKADRVDLSVSGTGSIAVADVAADQVNATLVGAGSMELAGKATRARLVTNGAGRIDASRLDAGDLFVALDGPGETRATARFNAQVNNSGLGAVSVAGSAKCTVSARAGGPVACGRN